MQMNPDQAITIAGIQCWDEGTRETFGRTTSSATRTISCAWADRVRLAMALLGGATGSGVNASITGALAYPDAQWLFADTAEPEGLGEMTVNLSTGMIAYEYSRLTVNYKSLAAGGGGGGAGSMQLSMAADVLGVPQDGGATFKWKSDNKPVPEAGSPNLSLSTATLIVPQRDLPELRGRVPDILSLFDHVNNKELFGAPEGHWLYKGADSFARQIGGIDGNPVPGQDVAGGLEAFDLSHRAVWRSQPWNYFFRPDTGWAELVYKHNGEPYFPPGNLNAIFG